ncbi:glycosyltransferase family 4 protein [Amedibacillus sp. YH-ame6]
MNVLYLSIRFKWDNADVHSDLIKTLSQRGHRVTVVTCGNKENNNLIEKLDSNVSLLNVNTGNQFTSNLIVKGINMITFENKMIKAIKRSLKSEKYDLILYSTPPITFEKVIRWCKAHYKCKTFLALKDIFPQNAVDLEMFSKNSIVYKFFRNKESRLYSVSDKIGCMSKKNIEYIINHNSEVDKSKLVLFPNAHLIRKYEVKSKLGEETTFIFGGNLGKPQGLKNLLAIITKLENYPHAKFVVIGKGSEDYLFKESKFKNLQYHSMLPKEEYDNFVEKADVGIISLDTRFTIPNIPSKMLNYMEISKPILAITDVNTDVKEIIEEANCGWWLNGDDIDGVINVIKNICNDKQSQIEKGKNAKKCLKENFDVIENVIQLESFVQNGGDKNV